MAFAAIPAAIGGATGALGIAQGAASIAGAVGARNAARSQAAQQASQARAAQVRGLEVEASLRDELERTLSSFNAARGANNLSLTSPTGAAIAGDIRRYARQDYITARRNTEQQVSQGFAAAQGTLRAGNYSLLTGVAKAAPSFLSMMQARSG